ncbi:MAG TPA: HD-GYP domain-containing protein [Defluviitaleaceae bacterium]|nr:HD-GYP domain-containing protein [Defluviitaleaceae bacterium]
MRLVPVSCLKGGEIIAKPVIDENGSRLLAKNTSFKKYYKKQLEARGIDRIYIADKLSEGIEIKDVISEKTRIKTINIVKDTLAIFKATQQIDVSQLETSVIQIVEDILSNKEILYDMVDIKTKDDYTYGHSVNVAVLCVMLGRKIGGDKSYLKKLALGGLLHDFGKILVPDEILNKPDKLTEEEFDIIKQHPFQGYQIFKDNPLLTPISKVMILMHHEKINGDGYPLGMTKNQIHEGARICSVCDVFDAMTSKRAYRNEYTIVNTLNEMERMTKNHLDEDLFKTFRGMICYYPVGTTVLLSNETVAIVEQNKIGSIDKPTVRVIYDLKTKQEVFRRVDLSATKEVKIERELISEEYINNPAILRAMRP